jgi:hypothetical protein
VPIQKGKQFEFQTPIIVHVLLESSTMEGVDFEDIISVYREEDNTIILTKINNSKIIIPGNKYYFMILGDK